MKEIKPTNETGKNPETATRRKRSSLFQTLKNSTASLSHQQKGAGVQSSSFGTGENQYRRLQVDDEGGQENGEGHQAPAALHGTPGVQLKGKSKKLTDFQKETCWLMLD